MRYTCIITQWRERERERERDNKRDRIVEKVERKSFH